MVTPKVQKLSGPIVTAEVKRMVSILAHDAGLSIESYLGQLVTEAIVPKWASFQEHIAADIQNQREERHANNGDGSTD